MKTPLALLLSLLTLAVASADTVTLAWDHDAESYAATTAYRLEARPVGSPDAEPIGITITNDGALAPVDGLVTGIEGRLLLPPGQWDVVCIAIGDGGESTPSNTASTALPPGPAQRLRILRATITIEVTE